jgi:uncharacterized protein YegP (UPF0339 family)
LAGRFELYKDAAGTFRFLVEGRQRRDHRVERGLQLQGQRQNGIESVKTNAPTAQVQDLT